MLTENGVPHTEAHWQAIANMRSPPRKFEVEVLRLVTLSYYYKLCRNKATHDFSTPHLKKNLTVIGLKS